MSTPTYPIAYTSEPGVVLLKAAKAPAQTSAATPAAVARQFPIAEKTQTFPLQGKA